MQSRPSYLPTEGDGAADSSIILVSLRILFTCCVFS
jgi:hypothetical protein